MIILLHNFTSKIFASKLLFKFFFIFPIQKSALNSIVVIQTLIKIFFRISLIYKLFSSYSKLLVFFEQDEIIIAFNIYPMKWALQHVFISTSLYHIVLDKFSYIFIIQI